ncbi:MAG: efflux RND transporter periplasmic adaptor subunit [Phycisphaeraceae bacterium]
MSEDHPQPPRTGGVRRKVLLSIVAIVVTFAAAGGTLVAIQNTEPEAQRSGATRKSSALVETVTVRRGVYKPELAALGRIEAAQDIVLSPRVGGQVLSIADAFEPGGVVERGQMLVQIDPADFETALRIRESVLRQAKAELTLEEGRQSVAKQEFELLDREIDQTNRALVLREPQLESRRAEIESAQAAVRRAELDLERTRIIAPFDAQVIHRTANVGSQIAAGEELARLVGTREYWVIATVPLRQLPRLRFAEDNGEGSLVRLRNDDRWGEGVYREGRLLRLVGTVDEQTRLARVLASVPDPLGRETDAPRLILGTYVDALIEANPIENVVRLDRDYVRERDTVWVFHDDKLEIRNAEVVFRDARHAYIRDGLDDGERVVTTTLTTVSEGIPLKLEQSEDNGEASHNHAPSDRDTQPADNTSEASA